MNINNYSKKGHSTYAYARVSSKDQNEERQLIAFDKLKIPKANIFIDKQSGKDFNRPAYIELVKRLKKNDLLCIKSIDRLGRDYDEILEQWRMLTKGKGVDIYVIDMPFLDFRVGNDLISTFVNDIVLGILSFVSENERENIKQRQKEGIEAAKKRGVKFGRPKKKLPKNFKEAYSLWKANKITGTKAAKMCRMPLSTFRFKALEYEKTMHK